MPRDGSNVYSKPAGTTAISGEIIRSDEFNLFADDVVNDLNNPRPISSGGTGESTVSGFRNSFGIDGVWQDTISALIANTTLTYAAVPAGTAIQTRDGFAYRVAPSDATDNPLVTAGGIKLYPQAAADGRFSLLQFGAVGDGVSDDSAALDSACDYGWSDYRTKMIVIIPSGTLLSKAGDFVVPPNLCIEGEGAGSKVVIGNAATRFYFKRDNTRVGTLDGVDYTADSNYWGLGPNEMRNLHFVTASGVVCDECVFVSDLVRQRFTNCLWEPNDFDTAVHKQNDAKWTEFWEYHNCSVRGNVNGILMSRTPASTFESFGHGRFNGALHARVNGAAGLRVTAGASAYNGEWNTIGFCSATSSGQEVYLFKLEGVGSDMRHTQITTRIENIANQGTPYAIHVDADADGTKLFGRFTGVGSATKFRGFQTGRVTTALSNRIDEDGSTINGLNGTPMILTPQADINGDNLLHYDGEQVVPWSDETPVAGAKFGALPYSASENARLRLIQVTCDTAPASNLGAVWHLGFVKQGAAFPTYTVEIPDGTTNITFPIDQSFPVGWLTSAGNKLIWRSQDGSGNNGTAPTGVSVLIHWWPGY